MYNANTSQQNSDCHWSAINIHFLYLHLNIVVNFYFYCLHLLSSYAFFRTLSPCLALFFSNLSSICLNAVFPSFPYVILSKRHYCDVAAVFHFHSCTIHDKLPLQTRCYYLHCKQVEIIGPISHKEHVDFAQTLPDISIYSAHNVEK